ncbi:MAG TPA: methyltransferase [Baekduia sp.]|nr:methyltransferase [Baekduia sp.]
MSQDLAALVARLEAGGFVAADEEADELLACAAGDDERLEALLIRRFTGEPLAWITGSVTFCGVEVRVDEGVYVPRWQSEQLALRVAERLPERGTAVDLCTGTGAIAAVLRARRPGARVVATEVNERAVTCARANGIEVFEGDLLDPLPPMLEGQVDTIVGVVPYVPTPELGLLQRDTFTFETALSYDGGDDGTTHLRRAIAGAPRFLRPGGALFLELGAGQPERLHDDLTRHGFTDVAVLIDEDGDIRGVEATLDA